MLTTSRLATGPSCAGTTARPGSGPPCASTTSWSAGEDFEAAQAKRLARGHSQRTAAERKPRTSSRPYALRGLLRCALCRRKMQCNFNNGRNHYRCRYTAEYARTNALDHPLTVYVREDAILPKLDAWIAKACAPGRLGRTLRALQESQERNHGPDPAREAARRTPSPTVTAASRSTEQPWMPAPTPPSSHNGSTKPRPHSTSPAANSSATHRSSPTHSPQSRSRR